MFTTCSKFWKSQLWYTFKTQFDSFLGIMYYLKMNKKNFTQVFNLLFFVKENLVSKAHAVVKMKKDRPNSIASRSSHFDINSFLLKITPFLCFWILNFVMTLSFFYCDKHRDLLAWP